MASRTRESRSRERFAPIPAEQVEQEDGQLSKLRLLTLDEFVNQPRLAYHIGRLVPAGAIVLVFGALSALLATPSSAETQDSLRMFWSKSSETDLITGFAALMTGIFELTYQPFCMNIGALWTHL